MMCGNIKEGRLTQRRFSDSATSKLRPKDKTEIDRKSVNLFKHTYACMLRNSLAASQNIKDGMMLLSSNSTPTQKQ